MRREGVPTTGVTVFSANGCASSRRNLLEFALAADLIRTAIAVPTWAGVGQLAAIAAIRTALNYFLERDIEAFKAKTEQAERARAQNS